MRRVMPLSSCLGLLAAMGATQPVVAAPSVELDQVLITDEEQTELTAATQRLREIPGASNMVDMQRVKAGWPATRTCWPTSPVCSHNRQATTGSSCRSAAQASIVPRGHMALASTRCSTGCH